ncbi:MAG TPA: caspase family protein [Thermoanaerobaculia bacterium]
MLIGINDYSASRLGPRPRVVPPERDWDNLSGTVTDVGLMQEMLVLLYGFDRRDIVTLTDQNATRAAILQTVEQHLVQKAAKGDVLFFYYAGHGSQVRNSLSDEADKLDESIVPADSRLGVRDIRDKELRRPFNRILDRGARLTILMDNCHSGSGTRGLTTGERPRGIKLDPRDVADRTPYGPRPEDRGALVLAASQDFDDAWEMRDDDGLMHGAFSWAWIRALRDSSTGESASETFARAAARIRAEKPYQAPVMSGTAQARFHPFLGARTDRPGGRPVVAVKDVRGDGTVLLHGGWANGLSVGSELRVVDRRQLITRVVVTAVHGLANSEGRVETGRVLPQAVRAGALLEIVGWAAPAGRPLRVWTPRVPDNVRAIAALAARLNAEATRRGLRWTSDPVDATPTHLLRRGNRQWELIGPGRRIETLGPEPGDAMAAIARIPAGSSLFVQFAAPAALVDGISIGPGTDREGIDPVEQAEDADYILVGRFADRRLSYAWVRPNVRRSDLRVTGLPLHTAWVAGDGRDATLRDSMATLRESVLRLRRIHAWQLLESPPESRYPYRLALRRVRDGALAKDVLIGEEKYDLLLHATGPLRARVPQRYAYVFMIDGDGNGVLLYPAGGTGSVENRYPAPPPAALIALANDAALQVTAPYGVDTYFLLTTDEPLPNPWVLQWDGVRGGNTGEAKTPLERLLALTGSASRSARIVTPSSWSLERVFFESVAPRARK